MAPLLNLLQNVAVACQPGRGGIDSSLVPTWYQYLDGQTDSTGRCVPQFTFPDDIGAVLLGLFDIALRISLFIAIGFVVYGGIRYVLSQGDSESAKTARQTVIHAVIGLMITIVATSVVAYLGNQFK